jgi:peptidoglycan hydrolase-like amidase
VCSSDLPSCPATIHPDEADNSWNFTGIGEGHGLGLSVERAKMLSEAGKSAVEILNDAFH